VRVRQSGAYTLSLAASDGDGGLRANGPGQVHEPLATKDEVGKGLHPLCHRRMGEASLAVAIKPHQDEHAKQPPANCHGELYMTH
jgi:hypothetical protein